MIRLLVLLVAGSVLFVSIGAFAQEKSDEHERLLWFYSSALRSFGWDCNRIIKTDYVESPMKSTGIEAVLVLVCERFGEKEKSPLVYYVRMKTPDRGERSVTYCNEKGVCKKF